MGGVVPYCRNRHVSAFVEEHSNQPVVATLLCLCRLGQTPTFRTKTKITLNGSNGKMTENATTSSDQQLPDSSTSLQDDGTHIARSAGITEDRFPKSGQETDLVEELLADEINSLSLVEKDQILFDVHGIPQTIDEDPPNIDELLLELERRVQAIPKKEAYGLAKYLNSDYVNDRAFRLKFLRADRFNVKLAAARLVKHFETKKELFGSSDVLAREVRLSDLSSSDMETLESGALQLLPNRDAAGRPILFLAHAYHTAKEPKNMARAFWYMLTTTMRDEDAQKRGIVMVIYNIGNKARAEEVDWMKRIHRMRQAVPKRIVGAHYCYSDAAFRPFVAGLRFFMEKDIRNRFRPHFGNYNDIQFELQTFGINTNDHPLSENGSLSLAWHREWLHIRKTQEEANGVNNNADGRILVPKRFDVLFGRDKTIREHTGNLRCAHLVDMYQEKYNNAGKYQKTEISERIVSIIHESYGRFLKWENGEGWVEVDHDAAREKIAHFFRHNRARSNKRASISSGNTHGGASESEKTAPVKRTLPSGDTDEEEGPKRVTPCPSPLHLDA